MSEIANRVTSMSSLELVDAIKDSSVTA